MTVAMDTDTAPAAEHRVKSGPGAGDRGAHRSRDGEARRGRSRINDLKRLVAMPAPALLAGGAAASFAGTMAVTRVADGPLRSVTRSIDHDLDSLARELRYPDKKVLDVVMTLFTRAGEPHVLYPLASLVAAAWVAQNRTADAGALMLALLGSAGINRTLKETVKRPRPILKLPLPRSGFKGYSFPSDHAAMSIATYGMIAVLVTRRLRAAQKEDEDAEGQEGEPTRGRARAIVAIPAAALLLCALIGWSRVYQGVHNPTDVLGGWLAGGVWLLTCSRASRSA